MLFFYHLLAMDWLHSRHLAMSSPETHKCTNDFCIPLGGGPAILHTGSLSLVLGHFELSQRYCY